MAGIPVLPHITGVPVAGGNGLDGRGRQTSLYCLAKRYCCATTGASSLTMKNVPYHEDVKQFGHAICAARNGEMSRGEGGVASALCCTRQAALMGDWGRWHGHVYRTPSPPLPPQESMVWPVSTLTRAASCSLARTASFLTATGTPTLTTSASTSWQPRGSPSPHRWGGGGAGLHEGKAGNKRERGEGLARRSAATPKGPAHWTTKGPLCFMPLIFTPNPMALI